MALLALAGVSQTDFLPALELAAAFLNRPGSLEAQSWLELALMAQGRLPSAPERQAQPPPPARTTRDISLRLLVLAAKAGNNPFAYGSPTS